MKILFFAMILVSSMAGSLAHACGAALSSTIVNGNTYNAYRGDGSVDCPVLTSVYYNIAYENSTKSALVDLGGYVIARPIVVADPSIGGVRFFVLGENHNVYYRTLTSDWMTLGGNCFVMPDTGPNKSGSGIAAQYINGQMYIAVIGEENTLFYRTMTQGWLPLTGLNSTSSPSLNSNLSFEVMGLSNTLYERTISSPWAPLQAAPGFFGMLINHLVSNEGSPLTPWPAKTSFSGLRVWDTGAAWSSLQPTSGGSYTWTNFDSIVSLATSHNVDILYTFGNTPHWALPKNISITSISRSDNLVTVTTSAPHGLNYVPLYSSSTQSQAIISGVKNTSFNGTWTISGTPTATKFTFIQAGANATSSGGTYSANCTGIFAGSGGCSEAPYNLSDWNNFVTAVATRSAGRIKYWEMWNEANLPDTWKGNNQTLVSMVQSARTIIKAIDPSAVILSPSVTNSYDDQSSCNTYDPGCGENWMNTWLGLGGKNYIDAVAFHGYPIVQEPEKIVAVVNFFKSVMTANGVGSLPLWDTESSWGQNISLPNSADQIAFIGRHLMLEKSSGVQRSYWYAYDDSTWGTLWWAPYLPGPGGLVGLAPTGTAYNTVYTWLENSSFISPCAELASDNTTWICTLSLSDGTTAEAIWNTSTSKSFSTPAQFQHYKSLAGWEASITHNSITISGEPILLVP